MAKANKSGLGRGLNSLLGGAFEEAAPLESTPKRVLVEQQREETVVPIPMHTEPVVERQNVSREKDSYINGMKKNMEILEEAFYAKDH